MGILSIFIDKDKLAKANATYRNRMEEIHEKEQDVKMEIPVRRAIAKQDFKRNISNATKKRNALIEQAERTGKFSLTLDE